MKRVLIIVLSLFMMCLQCGGALGEAGSLPESLSTIEDEAFMGDSSLQEIVLPEGTVGIGARAFAYSGLKSIVLPRSLREIAEDAFEGCAGLRLQVYSDTPAYEYAKDHGFDYVLLDETTDATLVEEGVCGDDVRWHFYSDGLMIIEGNGQMQDYMPKETIPWWSYRNDIVSVSIGPGVTNVVRNAFYESAVRSLELPEGLTSVGSYAFKDCASLKDFTIPESVTYIGESAFFGCTGLTAVDLPSGLGTVSANAFSSCSKIATVTVRGMDTSLGSYAFTHKETTLIRCLKGSKAEEWARNNGFDVEYLDEAP
ncbi:MAG: leucine-rich repeat domain-containing protein [Clostridia bacterium]|nr:leucine-rich repeat domain-containing protein [Clostridia bacterium]